MSLDTIHYRDLTMLRSAKRLDGFKISASDDQIGRVTDLYFDDEAWTIRYLVVDTGKWLTGRKVLISPYSVKTPLTGDEIIDVTLTRDQVRNSPDIDTHKPVSRQREREYLTYYGYPAYWGLSGVWGTTDFPSFPYTDGLQATPAIAGDHDLASAAVDREAATGVSDENSHLRSTSNVTSYDIQATDDSIGHVEDFIFDDETWSIRYLVVDTSNWWPGSRKVLVATKWIDQIDWEQRKVITSLSRDGVKSSPEYDPDALLDRQYEERLHQAHQRGGYWE